MISERPRAADARYDKIMNREAKKAALQMLSNGLYVITSGNGKEYGVATVSWVSQVSFDPPLVMAAIRKKSNVYKYIIESRRAALNILALSQEDIAGKYMRRSESRNDSLNPAEFEQDIDSIPVLRKVPAYLLCRVSEIANQEGDHAVVIMEVLDAKCRNQARPLTVADSPWKYGG